MTLSKATFKVISFAALTLSLRAAAPPACDPDNGGLKLPEGFCAFVAADGIGSARHAAVAPNGDLYVAIMGRNKGGVVALRDKDGDGRFETKETFGEASSTGIVVRNGYLYVATTTTVERYKLTPGELKPAGPPEIIVSGLAAGREHEDKGLTFDGKGSLYVNVGAPSNACQPRDRQPKLAGQDPCPLLEMHGGIWKFDENKLGQKQEDGTRFATGLRQMPAITWHDGALYIVMNNRDQLDTLWGDMFTGQENAERPAEPMYRAVQGSNFGWPYCFYDYGQKKLLLNPEYGGDGKTVGRCSEFTLPIASFPAHWAPVDVMFYSGAQFPAKYRGGAFIAFHGSWNRAPMPQDGYNVTFQPFSGEKPSGAFEVFANGFAGKSPLMNPNQAVARADGVAQALDGSLYITDSQKGRIWRVIYKGGK
ncbi:MAG: sorbosone dehydrogenase [Bryobacteraceae bacterium]|jgi:glucose/arabinose dehydrogenase